MTPFHVVPPRAALFALALVTIACGSTAGEASPDPDDTNVDPVVDRRYFVPEGLEMELLDATREDLELVAFTLQNGPEFQVAVRNNGTNPYCTVAVPVVFKDEAAGQLAAGEVSVFGSSMYRSAPADPLYNCIAPGEIGFGGEPGDVQGLPDVSTTASAVYQLRGYDGRELGNLVKEESVKVEGVQVLSRSSVSTVKGSVRNGGSVPIVLIDVLVYSLNQVGRPVAVGADTPTASVAAGGASDFSIDVAGPVGDHRVLLDFYE